MKNVCNFLLCGVLWLGLSSCGKKLNVAAISHSTMFAGNPANGGGNIGSPGAAPSPGNGGNSNSGNSNSGDPSGAPNTQNPPLPAPTGTMSIFSINSGPGYHTLWGACFDANSLVLVGIQSGEEIVAYTYVPCISNTWVYNEAYFSGSPSTYVASQHSTQATLLIDSSTPSYSDETYRACSQPYEWHSVQVPYFGNPTAWYRMATCRNSSNDPVPYVYAPTPIVVLASNGKAGPTGHQIRYMSKLFTDNTCTVDDPSGNVVSYVQAIDGHVGHLGTTRTYSAGDWVTWEWAYSPTWDIRTPEFPHASYYAQDPTLGCIPAFNASANFIGDVVPVSE